MKTIDFTYSGKTIHLYFNAQAMFAVNDLDMSEDEALVDAINPGTPDGAKRLCQVAAILAEQGEHCRRYLEYTPERIPSAEELRTILSPMQLIGLYTAAMQTINDGYDQGKAEDGDIDTGLAELEKKPVYNAATVFTDRCSLQHTAPGCAAPV